MLIFNILIQSILAYGLYKQSSIAYRITGILILLSFISTIISFTSYQNLVLSMSVTMLIIIYMIKIITVVVPTYFYLKLREKLNLGKNK